MNAAVPLDNLETTPRQQQESFHEYLRVLGRHRYSIVALTLLFGVLGALSAALEVPIYRATSTLLIERDAARYVNVQEVYGVSASTYEYFQTQYEILRTRPLAERVVEKVGVDIILQSLTKESSLSLRRILPWSKKTTLAPQSAADKKSTATSLLLSAVRVDPVRNSQLVRLSYEVADADLAAQLANALADVYIENTLEARLEMVKTASTWLSGRLTGLREKVVESQRKLQEYADQQSLVNVKGVDSLPAQNVSMLSQRVAEAQSLRLGKEAIYQQVVAAQNSGGSLENVVSLAGSALVADLRKQYTDAQQKVSDLSARYGPSHPSMVAAQNEATSTREAYRGALSSAADAIIRDYQGTLAVERQLQGQLSGAQNELRTVNRKSFEYERLQGEADANQQLYDKFQTQFKETSEGSGLQTSNARVVEKAQSSFAPIYPNTKRSVIAAALTGLALSIILAFLLEHLDNTIKTADDVEKRLQLPVLGLVPQLKSGGKSDHTPLRYFLDNPKTAFSEAVRTVRTGVLLSGLNKQHKRLLVTSSVPGEGKTTMSLNLAQAMSQMNKVLLIDADLRRPSVARAFGDGKPQLGLSQFIAGEAKISECVHQLEGSNTYVMTAGVIPPNPLELLSSHKFSEALDNLGKVFDYIVIDCAPALAVSDALVLSRLVDGVIYVVRSDSTPFQAAQSGLKRLRRVDAPLLGIVLNRVGERTHGYGYGRYAYYADGYYPHYGYYQADKKK